MFGNNYISGQIHGYKFADLDGDGVWDFTPEEQYVPASGEPGIDNILIGLVDANGNVVELANGMPALTTSMADGQFWFTDVIPNQDVTVVEFLNDPRSDSNNNGVADGLEGMYQTTDLNGTVSVGPAEALYWNADADPNTDLMIGNAVYGSIHGFKFADFNVDGVYQPGNHHWETPMEWVAFQLLDENGDIVDINGDGVGNDDDVEYTDVDGQFWFTDLPIGTSYTVIERLDLTDRNDLNGDGFPDEGGNGVPDDQEGLFSSTPDSWTVTIGYGEEYVWTNGASGINQAELHIADPDFGTSFPNVTIENIWADVLTFEVYSDIEATLPITVPNASTGARVFGHEDAVVAGIPVAVMARDEFAFAEISQGGQSNVLRATFDLDVRSVSIDVIANDDSDQGLLVAYDANGVVLGFVESPELTASGQVATITVTSATPIAYVEAGGSMFSEADSLFHGGTVGLDNLRFETFSLKHEVLVGNDLVFGNYYAGAVHGIKTQEGTGAPAPNIELELVDMNQVVQYTATTNEDGEYWFTDVIPGMYSLREVESPAVITGIVPFPVEVTYGTVLVSESGLGMPYPGLQTEELKSQLAITNLIEGSIHGLVVDQNDAGVEGVTVALLGTGLSTVTDADGEFHFDQLTPNAQYIVQVDGDEVSIITVGSGEEEVAFEDQAPLDPGQYETVNGDLNNPSTPGDLVFQIDVTTPPGPQVTSIKVGSDGWNQSFLDYIDPVDGLGYEVPDGGTPLPWVNINRIYITFSDNVSIDTNDVSLLGFNVADYGGVVSYSNMTATITLGSAIGADNLLLQIDDTVTDGSGNPLDGDANGEAGTDYEFSFSVLPGDANQTGAVTGGDVTIVRNAQFTSTTFGAYSEFKDVNGSGAITGGDVTLTRNRQFTQLPGGFPILNTPTVNPESVDRMFEVANEDVDGDGVKNALPTFDRFSQKSSLRPLARHNNSSVNDSEDEREEVTLVDDLFANIGQDEFGW